MTKQLLNYNQHTRSFHNFSYVYPVVSRRSQGVSLGINLNLNNSCNWRCVYCQVDGLIRGKPEAVDLPLLEQELDTMLEWIIHGDFLTTQVSAPWQRFNDICIAGNGEPTLSPDFAAVMQLIAKLRAKYHLGSYVKTILITNGSEVHKPKVQAGLEILAALNGQVWFKIDRATPDKIAAVNQIQLSLPSIINRLTIASQLCPTYIQSCWFNRDGIAPSADDITAFIELVAQVKPLIAGILLYSTARNPALPEGKGISQVSQEFLTNLANRLHSLDINVKAYQ
jgi:wyosine [tRNA(Phe)-imidazoG37] synthetase (radical SAM superfamily)